MPDTLERIGPLLPELESVVYDSLARVRFGSLFRDEETGYMRTRIAMGPWCAETSKAAKNFFMRCVGEIVVRQELHAVDDLQHQFLSIPSNGEDVTPEDIIIDATYLQFADTFDTEEVMANHPNIFVGTRAAIITLMRDQNFTSDHEIENIYQPHTLVSLE